MDYIKESEAYLRGILHALVDHPEALKVKSLAGRRSVIFEVESCPRDFPWIIGRKGRTAEALRELMSSKGGRRGQRFILEFFGAEAEPITPSRPSISKRRVWRPKASNQ